MVKNIEIINYKSIEKVKIDLGRVNVFIGENGSGKSNILEAVAMLSCAKENKLSVEDIYNKGIRVTKPLLTTSSFLKKKRNSKIYLSVELEKESESQQETVYSFLDCTDADNILTDWNDIVHHDLLQTFESKAEKLGFLENIEQVYEKISADTKLDSNFKDSILRDLKEMKNIKSYFSKKYSDDHKIITNFQIYSPNISVLRGIIKMSLKPFLGLYGENLDLLLANFNKEEKILLNKYLNDISWLKKILFEQENELNLKEHKIGKSISKLYFSDKFMSIKNNIFSAENANEGALFILFYLGLFISKSTPKFFAIDNIETALNPALCRKIIGIIADLSVKNDKQALITTHNPAVLDGLNLNDPMQKLFVVKRTNDGRTKVEQIKVKPNTDLSTNKLSELWMRGYLGGLPINF